MISTFCWESWKGHIKNKKPAANPYSQNGLTPRMPLPLKASKEWLFGRGQLGDVCPEMYWCPGACVAELWGKVDIEMVLVPCHQGTTFEMRDLGPILIILHRAAWAEYEKTPSILIYLIRWTCSYLVAFAVVSWMISLSIPGSVVHQTYSDKPDGSNLTKVASIVSLSAMSWGGLHGVPTACHWSVMGRVPPVSSPETWGRCPQLRRGFDFCFGKFVSNHWKTLKSVKSDQISSSQSGSLNGLEPSSVQWNLLWKVDGKHPLI